jgi:hypothetical protein
MFVDDVRMFVDDVRVFFGDVLLSVGDVPEEQDEGSKCRDALCKLVANLSSKVADGDSIRAVGDENLGDRFPLSDERSSFCVVLSPRD